MKNSRLFKRLKKSGGARALALIAAILLASEPFAFALSQVVYKYPTGTPTIGSVDMGGGNILYYGDVFGFNSAKNTTLVYGGSEAVAPPDVYAEIREGACRPEGTNYDFGTGTQGWIGTTAATGLSYMYDGVIGGGSIKAYFARKSTSTANFTWEKAFFYDCGAPSTFTFAMQYVRDVWNNAGATNNFTVTLVRPDLTTKVLVNAQNILDTLGVLTSPTITQPVTGDLTQVGTYKLRITGTLTTLNTGGSKVAVAFDNINLAITPVAAYTSFQQDVQLASSATPFSSLGGALNGYRLEIRARKAVDDAEATYVKVLTPPSTWNTRYTIPADAVLDGQANAWALYDTYYLTDAEYNNGTVSVKYVDALASGDSSQGGVDVEFQRVRVDQSNCVDSVRDGEADCGKCHNYNADVTKAWPTLGMHNKHAQTESVSDCLWCHPNNGSDSAHRDGAVKIDGTKVFKLATTPTSNPSLTNQTYNATDGRCSNIDCHKGIQTPAWTATYPPTGPYDGINTIARNCSRCHNSGTPGADTYGQYNLAVAWPNDAGGGHASHNNAFTINEASCQTNGSCHPDNRGQHSKVGDSVIEVKMQSSFSSPGKTAKYLTASKTCANVACHGGQQTPAFNLASTNLIDVPTQCTKCHAPEKADGWLSGTTKALQYNAPLSGLHRGSPPTSGKNHIDYACTTCHNLPAKHFREGAAGTNSNLHTKDMDPVVSADIKAATIGYVAGTGTSPNYTTPPSCATPTVAACHAETLTTNRSPATFWKRRWSWDSYAAETPDAEKVKQCNGCHGHWTTFVDGVVQPHVTSNSDPTLLAALSGNHSDSGVNCGTMCHAQNDPAYNHGVSMTATSKDMTLNTNAGIVRTAGPPARVGCSFCHASNDGSIPDGGGPATNHVFAEANWVTDTAAAGPTPTCSNDVAGCHGNVASNKYWPDGLPSSTYPDKAGEHDTHMTKLALKVYGETATGAADNDILRNATTLNPGLTSDAKQKAICVYCHNTLSPGLAGHTSDATANQAEVSSFKRIWDGAADAVTAGTFSAADGSCSNVDCHNNKATTTTYGWRAGAASACLMCHNNDGTGTNNPTTGLHFGTLPISTNTHDDSFKAYKAEVTPTASCVSCHTTTPSSAHINGTFNSSPAAVAAIITFASTVGFIDNATAPTCTPNGALVTCHTDAGTWTRKWSTTAKNNSLGAGGTECDNCHGGFSGSDWTFGSDNAIGDYNVSHAKDWDGTLGGEIYGNHSGTGSYTTKCNICHVYGDSPYTPANFATYHNNGTVAMNTMAGSNTYAGTTPFTCTNTCHDNNTNHGLEASSSVAAGSRLQLLAGPALSCTGCHGGATPKAGVSATSPHVTRGRMTGYNTFNACTDCHPGNLKGLQHQKNAHANVILIPNDATAGIGYVTGTNGYSGDSGVVLGGDFTATVTTEADICWGCHTNDTYNLSVTKTTITFVDGGANPDTIVDSASGLGGYAVGKLVTITGSSQAGNNKTFPIVAVAANSISVPAGSLTADGTAGESVTLRERVSEWGMNTDTNGTAANYSNGGLYNSSAGTTQATAWLTSTTMASNTTNWISDVRGIGSGAQSFAYKTGRTQSTHAASSSGVSGLDAVANIRCSYCHDVHNTKAGSPSGAPYLRGTWMGNPYREDGAPQAGQTYTNADSIHGLVPRGGTAYTVIGGYQIDQNNSNPTTAGVAAHTVAANAAWSLTNNAGLCTMCHGSDVDNMNKFGTASAAWMGSNGHSNAAIGGTGANKVNIFRMATNDATYTSVVGRFASAATPALFTGAGSHRGAPRQSYMNAGVDTADTVVLGDSTSTQRGYGFRSQNSSGYMFTPQVGNSSPYAFEVYNWGAHVDDSAAQTQYHKFSCSKCHNPHASRLPRLMITNCLDTRKNTWDDALSTISGTGVSTENASAKISQLTSAQNCHRLKNTAEGAGARGAGWNKVTPWTSEGAPDTVVP